MKRSESASPQLRFLVPLRYPLTAQSTCTLAHAQALAQEQDEDVELIVMHVNLFQHYRNVSESEIYRAVDPLLTDVPYSVITTSGFLVEELILNEAESLDVDTIIVGKNRSPWWRRVLGKLFHHEASIGSFLQKGAGDEITVETVGSPA